MNASVDLGVCIEIARKAKLARYNAAIVASSDRLANKVRDILSPMAGTWVEQTEAHGVDFAPDKMRSQGMKPSKHKKRFRNVATLLQTGEYFS